VVVFVALRQTRPRRAGGREALDKTDALTRSTCRSAQRDQFHPAAPDKFFDRPIAFASFRLVFTASFSFYGWFAGYFSRANSRRLR
jgi:hypothetical protein